MTVVTARHPQAVIPIYTQVRRLGLSARPPRRYGGPGNRPRTRHEFDHDQHAGVSDFLDGYFARIWGQQSSLGRMLDPIADKLLVASCLLILGAEKTIHGWSLLAAIVILCREILVSGLREYLAELRVSVPVTRLAKWKTTLQLVAVGFLICGEAGDAIVPVVTEIGIALLWLSALLTLYTGWDYLQAGLHHLTKEDV